MDLYGPPHTHLPNITSFVSDGPNGPRGVPEEPVTPSEMSSEDYYHDLDQTQVGSNKAQQWYQQHHFRDSGIVSMENSKPSSIMSTNVNNLKNLPQLSQIPQGQSISSPMLDEIRSVQSTHSIYPSESLLEPLPSVSAPTVSFQTDAENAKRVLPDLIPLIDDSDEEVASRALEMITHIAKLDTQQHYLDPVISDKRVVSALCGVLRKRFEDKKSIRLSLCALFHISNREHGMELILTTVHQNSLQNFLFDLIRCIQVEEWACFKYALLILHNLMTDKSVGKEVVEYSRKQKAMSVIIDWLGDRNEKLLSVTVDILQLLCDKNREQKNLFLNLNGAVSLCSILSWARYEHLLWRTTRLLKSIAMIDPQKVVDSGAFDVLHINLDHPSQRLIIETLLSLRDISDVSTSRLDVSPTLAKLVQLLAVGELRIRQLCVQSLANLSANNRQNKEFLCQINVVGALKYVLFESEAQLEQSEEQSRQVSDVLEDIQENSLTALRNLYSGHCFETAVQRHVLSENGSEFFLRKLISMRPALLRRVLLILAKVSGQEANLSVFKDTRIAFGGNPMESTGFIDRIVYLLHVSASKYMSTASVENISLSELMNLCLITLEKLCADPSMKKTTIQAFKDFSIEFSNLPNLAPIFLISQPNEALQQSAISLMKQLVIDRDIANVLMNDSRAMEMIEKMGMNNVNPNENAMKLLQQLHQLKHNYIDENRFHQQLTINNVQSFEEGRRSASPMILMTDTMRFDDSGFGSENNLNNGEVLQDGKVTSMFDSRGPYLSEMDEYPLASVFCPSDGQPDELVGSTLPDFSNRCTPNLMEFSR